MLTLCLDTTGGSSSIALGRDGQLMAETLLSVPGKRQNAWLLPELDQLLASCEVTSAEIDLFACASGPGSFTGVRTGVATIQGLALAHGKPCVGISTLAILAMNLPHAAHPVCPLLDARKNEVYAGLYRCGEQPAPLMPDQALPPAELLERLSGPTIFLGDGALRYRLLIEERMGSNALFAPPSHHLPRAACAIALAEAAHHDGRSTPPAQLRPNYLRLSEAELAKQSKI